MDAVLLGEILAVAPTMPVDAASSVATMIAEMPRPPRTGPNSWPMVVSRSSAIFERSSSTPITTNNGTAISTSLVRMPQ